MPIRVLSASSQAPAWEFSNSSFPFREAGASLPGFPSWSSRRYTQVFKSTSFRQGLPETRAQGCECSSFRQFPRCKTYRQLGHCHPWLLDPGNPCRDDGVTQTLVYNDESWSLGTSVRVLSVVLLLGLSGCTLMQPQQVIDKPELMPIAQPLGPARRIVQQINAVWAGRQESLLAVLELDAKHIAMAGLSSEGLSLFNLTYDGNTVVSDKSPLLPESVNPEFIISDLQLVYWPIAELQKKLPVNWRLEVAGNKRILTVGNKKQVEVNYLSPDPVWPKAVELVNFQYNYRLNIKTISYDLIPE